MLNSRDLEKQLLKYTNELDPNYFNFENKRVVLVIKDLKVSLNHKGLKNLLRTINAKQEKLIIVTDLKQIKKLY